MNEKIDTERYNNLPEINGWLGFELSQSGSQNLCSWAPHWTTSPQNPSQIILKSSIW